MSSFNDGEDASCPPNPFADKPRVRWMKPQRMKMTYLDVKGTHGEGNPCPAGRFVMLPNGGLQCLDCGAHILWKSIDVSEVPPSPFD